MSIGQGKYNDEATMVRERTGAEGVALIVVGGNKGNGFSVQATAEVHKALPKILRAMLDEIEKDLKKMDI